MRKRKGREAFFFKKVKRQNETNYVTKVHGKEKTERERENGVLNRSK